MRINWSNWGQPIKQPRSVMTWFKRVFAHKPVPLHMSSHYRRESFQDDGQPKLF
jgi:hypothetical protein